VSSDTPEGNRAEVDEARGDWSPPTRGRVFGEFWWRSLALATAGGGVIGFVVGPLFIIDWGGSGDTVQAAIVAAPFGAIIGAALGLLLGALAGIAIGAVGAFWLVPYRGEVRTRRALRATAFISVGMWSLVYRDETALIFLAIVVPSLVGAWWISPWVGGWYFKWMSEATSRTRASGATPH
jgi:hypothetical protein